MASIKLKIISDGSGLNTQVVDAETGAMVSGVKSVSWALDDPMGLAEATFVVYKVPIEVTAEGETQGTQITVKPKAKRPRNFGQSD